MPTLLLLWLACASVDPADASATSEPLAASDGPAPPDTPAAPWVPPAPDAAARLREAYPTAMTDLAAARRELAAALAADPDARPEIVARASEVLGQTLASELLPAWHGTPWAFYGTSEQPGEGTIACGYLVSTVLRDAGFRVERVKLAQQAAEHIIQTLIPEPHIRRFRTGDVHAVVDAVNGGPGVWIVGLDFHVGFLVSDGEDARFCHSSYLEPVAMVCEPARTAPAMASRYHVIGRLLAPETVLAWLREAPLPTRTR